MVSLQIRVDEELRDQAQQIASDLGMDLTTAVRIFLKQMVNDQGLPFRPERDPFHSPRNQNALKQSLKSLNAGQLVRKTLDELEQGMPG